MSFSYLNGKKWIDISREERLFCAHLYFQIQKDVNKFIDELNRLFEDLSLPMDCEWEVGYEVCFYRDFLSFSNRHIKIEKQFPSKRTFDLCLFSEKEIVIIEAKYHERFKQKQLDEILYDKKLIHKILIRDDLKIKTILIGKSQYIESKNFLKTEINRSNFPYKLSWKDLSKIYKNDIFVKDS